MAAPSSAQTKPSDMTTTAPMSHPKIACGPPIAAIISGMVTNGPMPHICVMLIAVAGNKPKARVKWGTVAGGLVERTGGVDAVILESPSRLGHKVQPTRGKQQPTR